MSVASAIRTSHIDIAPTEYVTKYTVNRNFLKLVENDKALSSAIDQKFDTGSVHSYVEGKEYSNGDFVFYKTSDESQSLYLLSCAAEKTSDAPATFVNRAGDLAVKSSDSWKIVGIPSGAETSPRDVALEYASASKQTFLHEHQENTALSAHPTGKLGMDDSATAFRSLENMSENRQTFFFPAQLKTLNPDNSVIAGYMRKWENGLLEYDIIFRVGYDGEVAADGQQVLSANNLEVYHRNQNFLYFKDNTDFKIFSKQGGQHITANGTKQVNLNQDLNAYFAEIKFPEEFMDLNYMVFTSGVKNIETEAKSIKNQILDSSEFDQRLVIDGLTITGHDVSADYSQELKIPSKAVNIGELALSYIEEANALPVEITIDKDASLVNIGDRAFEGTAIKRITVPKHVKCIGRSAFENCTSLQQVDIWVNKDKSKQPRVDYDAFEGATSLEHIDLWYYQDPVLFSMSPESERRAAAYASEIDLSAKLSDDSMQKMFGINSKGIQVTSVRVHDVQAPMARKMLAAAPATAQSEEEPEASYTTLDVKDFISYVQQLASSAKPVKSKKMLMAAQPMLAAPSEELRSLFLVEDNVIVGYKQKSSIEHQFSLDFTDPSMQDIVGIADYALSDCSYLTSINVQEGSLASVGVSAFAQCNALQSVCIERSDFNSLAIAPDAFSGLQLHDVQLKCNSDLMHTETSFVVLIDQLVLSGNGSAASRLTTGLSAGSVQSLSVIGFHELMPQALGDVRVFDSIKLEAPPAGTEVRMQAFYSPDGLWSDKSVKTFASQGSLTCDADSMQHLYVQDELSIDLKDSLLKTGAFRDSFCRVMKLARWREGKVITTTVGGYDQYDLTAFQEGAFEEAQLQKVYFTDLDDMSEVSRTLVVGDNHNVLSCENGAILRSKQGSDPAKVYGYTVFNGELVESPRSSLLFIDEHNAIVSCEWEKIAEMIELEGEPVEIQVPFGVTAVSSDAFSRERPDEERFLSAISQVFFPVTLKRLADRAFSDMPSLQSISFEDGTDLDYAGESLFDSNDLSIGSFELRAEH